MLSYLLPPMTVSKVGAVGILLLLTTANILSLGDGFGEPFEQRAKPSKLSELETVLPSRDGPPSLAATARIIEAIALGRNNAGEITTITITLRSGRRYVFGPRTTPSQAGAWLRDLFIRCGFSFRELCVILPWTARWMRKLGVRPEDTRNPINRLTVALYLFKDKVENNAKVRKEYSRIARENNARLDLTRPVLLTRGAEIFTIKCWDQANICLTTKGALAHKRHHCVRAVSECLEDVRTGILDGSNPIDVRDCYLLSRQAAATLASLPWP